MPEFQEVARLSAGATANFAIQQNGADFAADLTCNHCTADGTFAAFTPEWSSAAPNAAGSAAFAIYQLTFDPQAAPVTLTLVWNGAAPAEQDCWVGLSDWSGHAWRWQQPVAGHIELTSPERFTDANQHCFATVMLLGSAPGRLATIGFGTPPAPPANGDGYTLFTPLLDTHSYLIDMNGAVVHQWNSNYPPGATAELLENGHIMRAEDVQDPRFPSGGRGGRLAEYDWDGNEVWSYQLCTAQQCTNHDFTRLPNGNILMLVTNIMTPAEVVAQGRNPESIDCGSFWVDSIEEIKPTQPSGGTVVWRWRVVDHLVQDFDVAQPNYGAVGAHPELLDLNFPEHQWPGDWTHCNCVAYNEHLDQVMITSLHFSEIWVVDHSTTLEEAAGHSGGHCGHGGDLLYRWGNPQAYKGGTAEDEQFFYCHNGHWIADGLPGAGNVLVFKNRTDFKGYSSVVELTLPLNPDGTYALTGPAYGPAVPSWSWHATPCASFYSNLLSSVQRLPGGETFVDSGVPGKFFVIDAAGKVKWSYQNVHPHSGASVYRALRYLPDYPGLAQLTQP